jgi:glycerol-3-phosphate dehydrogenase
LARPLQLSTPEQYGARQVPAHLLDGARFNLALVQTAAQLGATVVNHAAAQQLLYRNGRAVGALVRDDLIETHGGQQPYEVQAKLVINATGSAVDAVRRMDDLDAPALLAPGGKSQVTLRQRLLPDGAGLLLPLPQDGGSLMVVPWLGRTVLLAGGSRRAQGAAPSMTELLNQLGHLGLEVGVGDVMSVWVGQTLDAGPSDAYLEASRTGLLSVVGLQWSGVRRLAQDAVDAAAVRARLRRALRTSDSGVTFDLPLLGAAAFTPGAQSALASEYGLEADVAALLHETYGDQAPRVAALAVAGLGARLAPGLPFIEAQVTYAVEAELAQTADDVLERRTRMAQHDRLAAEAARGRVQQLLESAAPRTAP